jgi:WD40 repeat protein
VGVARLSGICSVDHEAKARHPSRLAACTIVYYFTKMPESRGVVGLISSKHVRAAFSLVLSGLILSGSAICQSTNRSQERQTVQVLTNPRKVIEISKGRPTSIVFSSDDRVLAVGSYFGDAELWDMSLGTPLDGFLQVPNASYVNFSPDGQTLATGNGGKTIRLWNVETGQLKATLVESDRLPRIAFSPDSRKVATATLESREARIWDVRSGKLEATLIHPKPYEYADGVENVLFSTDGKTLITSSTERIYLWDVATGKLRSKLVDPSLTQFPSFWNKLKEYSHSDSIYTLALSPDGQILASGSRDTTAKLWDLETGKLKTTLGGYKGWTNKGRIWLIAFSPDSKTLATGSDDKTVKLWDTSTGHLKATLQHRGSVQSLSFSRDGKLIATASDNERSANVWNAETGELLAKLENAHYPVQFSPDGKTLATASHDKKVVLLWDVPH